MDEGGDDHEEIDLCAICMDPLDGAPGERPLATMPSCPHRFHVACLLNCAQYDARCPVCRSVADGVTLRRDDAEAATPLTTVVLDMEELESHIERAHALSVREWRRYSDRRRRVLRQRPYLAERVTRLREIRVAMDREFDDANRIYDRKCRELWRADPEVKAHRDALVRLRRRERRVHRLLEEELEELIGAEPQ